MAIDIATLKIELFTGSFTNTLYSANVSLMDVNALADTLNTRGLTGSSITVGTVYALSLQECVVVGEYSSLTTVQRDLWNAIITTATNGIAVSNTLIRSQIAGVWSATTTTRTNLAALQTRSCSRGETLFGENIVVDTNSIYVALTL
jgi:vacuolar-type H+-ATPase subunit B/Vma2